MKSFEKAVVIKFRVTLGDLFQKISVKLHKVSDTLVPMSKKMGGAEKTATF